MTVVPSGPSESCISRVRVDGAAGRLAVGLDDGLVRRDELGERHVDVEAGADEPDPDLGRGLEVGVVDDLDLLDARAALADLVGIDDERPDLLAAGLIGTEPSKCMRASRAFARWRSDARSSVGQGYRRGDVGGRFADEPRPAADRAERVDDPVVLGEVARVLALDGHAADRIEQHDVVDDRFERDRLASAPPATVAGPGAATKSARPRRTWTSSARIESATSSAVSAPRSRPAGARSAASRSSASPASSRSHVRTTLARVGEATSPTYGGIAGERGGGRLLVPDRPAWR